MNIRNSHIDDDFLPPRLPIWKKIVRYLYEDACHKLMRPQMLLRCIEEGSLHPIFLQAVEDTLWTRSVVRWEDWKGERKRFSSCSENGIDYRWPNGQRNRLEMEFLRIPELDRLIKKQTFENYTLNIDDVCGISASKSMTHDIKSIDEFPLLRCRELVEPVSIEHLHKNMNHMEIRLDDMRFSDFQWAKRRIHWHNAGGSHHFAAARYQAVRLGCPVPLSGTMTKYTIDKNCLLQLRNQWSMYLLPRREVFGKFYEAMVAFQCAFGQCELPRNLHNTQCQDELLTVIWLRKDDPKAQAVSQALSISGFTNFGRILDALGQSVSS